MHATEAIEKLREALQECANLPRQALLRQKVIRKALAATAVIDPPTEARNDEQAGVIPPSRAEPAGQRDAGMAGADETLDEKALNTLLWFYRRTQYAYGRLPFAEEAITGLRERIASEATATVPRVGGNTSEETVAWRVGVRRVGTKLVWHQRFFADKKTALACETQWRDHQEFTERGRSEIFVTGLCVASGDQA